ncbi:Uu.00g010740.m01.CDS01 [Anthostomella pinea]|uniref:Uu.00g010740.m01.CDS01 n=1 Tax=Anthostomella pinea TaxID=933095 RepID=A0AAI8VY87_9PEZI|nr:Uu.00g010740.m01.CDS01 [Anthostomella pinea]
MLPQIPLHSRDTHSGHGIDLAVFAKETERKINILDRAIDEYVATELRERHEKYRRVVLVRGLRAEHGWRLDQPVGHSSVGVPVRGVESPRGNRR